MSYRDAWGKIKETERVMGFKLMDKPVSNQKGYRLTDTGRLLTERFMLWFDAVERDALEKAQVFFPRPTRSYRSKT